MYAKQITEVATEMKYTKWLRFLIGLICAAVIILIASQFIGIHNGLFSSAGGSCIAVVFDKAAVMGADKVVYKVEGKEITITDPEDVKKIASQFVVANRAGLCNAQDDRYMYIYNGDRLVRSLRWRCCEEIVDIYEEDATHWLLPPECHTGQVELSREFLAYLDDLLSSD
jgi:hypothetical protein